jgi:hypothetical protein
MKSKDGREVVEICYDELYSLLGQLLTLNDAIMTDERQRSAQKTLIKRTCYDWLDNLYRVQKPDVDISSPRAPIIPPYDPTADSGQVAATAE